MSSMMFAGLIAVILVATMLAIRVRSSMPVPAMVQSREALPENKVITFVPATESTPAPKKTTPAVVLPFRAYRNGQTVRYIARSGRLMAAKVVDCDSKTGVYMLRRPKGRDVFTRTQVFQREAIAAAA